MGTGYILDLHQEATEVEGLTYLRLPARRWGAMSHGSPPSWSGSASIDQAICGIGAGIVSTFCMQPLDLLKVKFQVATASKSLGIYQSLSNIVNKDGLTGLYRGIGVNMVGNAASWGLYFLWYTMLKERAGSNEPGVKLNAGQHLLCSAESGIITAFMTNPLWVIKTRMFTTSRSDKKAYRNIFDGLYRIARYEGLAGLYKGTVMSLVGVSNGAIQFMAYEELKKLGRERKIKRGVAENEAVDLSNTEYIAMSGAAKMFAIGLTYPYQVVRSRLQYQDLGESAVGPHGASPYTSIRDVVIRTYRHEGLRAFYKGLAPNTVRILPGTCVTFVVYENLSAYIRQKAEAKARTLHEVAVSS